jgi:hypothetical protein
VGPLESLPESLYLASLGTYNVELKKILELKFCEPGVCVFSKNGLRTKFKSFNHILI